MLVYVVLCCDVLNHGNSPGLPVLCEVIALVQLRHLKAFLGISKFAPFPVRKTRAAPSTSTPGTVQLNRPLETGCLAWPHYTSSCVMEWACPVLMEHVFSESERTGARKDAEVEVSWTPSEDGNRNCRQLQIAVSDGEVKHIIPDVIL